MQKNNIFRFASKELSQDAFLAWLINWVNIDEDLEIKKLAKEFLIKILGDSRCDIKWKNLISNGKPEIEVKVQFYNIDVLIIIHDKDENLAIIIEDKVNTLEHDSQIQRYENILLNSLEKSDRQRNYNKENLKIITCYYKIYDECNVENKSVNVIFKRDDIISLMETYKGKIKKDYFNEYLEYLQEIEKCSKQYDNDESDLFSEKKKKDIKYLAFFKSLEKEYQNYINTFSEKKEMNYYGRLEYKENKTLCVKEKNDIKIPKEDRICFGIASSGNGPTWWCNIPINCKCENTLNCFEKYAFIKINFYDNGDATIRLKVSKKHETINNKENFEIAENIYRKEEMKYFVDGEYYKIYDKYFKNIIDNTIAYNDILSKIDVKKYLNENETNIKNIITKSGKGSTKTQPEMNIFTINVPKTNLKEQMDKIKILIKDIKNDLDGKVIKID